MARVRGTYLGVIAVCMLAMTPFVFSACGGEAEYTTAGAEAPLLEPSVDVPDEEVVADDERQATSDPSTGLRTGERRVFDKTEELILSKAYDGALIVHLEPSKQPVSGGNWQRATSDERRATEVESVVASYPNAKLRPFLDTDPDQLDKRRKELERLSGKKMPDWNSVFVVDIAEPATAVRLFRELGALSGIEVVYPRQKPIPLDLAGTPDLTGLQGYLYPEATHGGLNAMAAWREGITGNGVALLDGETDWNLNHEDILLGSDRLLFPPDCRTPPYDSLCSSWVNHGTGVVGIMGGIDNGHGITGMAPGAEVYALHYGDASGLVFLTDGSGVGMREELPGGSVIAVEIGVRGALSDPMGPSQYGGLPLEVAPFSFDAIRQAVAAGIIVVGGAANGSIDIGNPDAYLPSQVNISLPENDSGSIVVGGSYGTGHDHRRPSELNCGTRVDVFAWGSGVVTTGYPYDGNPFTWTTVPGGPNPPNDDPNRYFINNFGGTSAATAMVAGAAALVQSYAKRELAHGATRYLMPLKMRDILVNSGVPQTATDGCNIGMQPRVDEAMRGVDGFLADARTSYPELDSGEELTEERMIALRTLGIGIICKEFDPVVSDPLCPDAEVFPAGERLAKDLDFDGDGRADIVQWTNSTWKLDLSSRGDGISEDNFGAWDIEIEHLAVLGEWVWPYVIDMNRDGRTDFVMYDKENGKWYIAFTDSALIQDGVWHGWDWTIDYSATWRDTLTLDPFGTDPAIPDARYSRPVPGDYNNDGWIDIAIACSDGNWRIDHGGPSRTDFGAFERTVRYLSDAQLAEAPGWAYPVSPADIDGLEELMIFKIPDDLPDAGQLYILDPTGSSNWVAGIPHEYGGNDEILVFDNFCFGGDGDSSVSKKLPNGTWTISRFYDLLFGTETFEDVFPSTGWGGIECIPLSADFNGDGWADRAVMCPDGWRISYASGLNCTSPQSDFRHIPLGYDRREFTLPGRSYSGGISFSYTKELIEFFQLANPDTDTPIPVDMPAVFSF